LESVAKLRKREQNAKEKRFSFHFSFNCCTFAAMKARWILFLAVLLLFTACSKKKVKHTFTDELLLPMTPVKNQGKSELCWAYAMLAMIETEHILRGDSVNLSPVYIGRKMMLHPSPNTKHPQRAMGQTLLNVMKREGIVPYDVLPDDATDELPTPQSVFMLGEEYTPCEFAHSVCAPDEYLSLTCFPDSPYYKKIVVPVPDNWEKNRLLNLPLDTLRQHIDSALHHRHPVCWESRGHAMCIVGLAHDENQRPYYIMKNSWGTNGPHKGLVYMSARKMWKDMIALYLTKEAYDL
jgi:bleomycin hydrolase